MVGYYRPANSGIWIHPPLIKLKKKTQKKCVKVGPHLTNFLDPRTRKPVFRDLRPGYGEMVGFRRGSLTAKTELGAHASLNSRVAGRKQLISVLVVVGWYFSFFCEQTVATLLIRRRILIWVTVFISNKQDTWLSLMCHVHFLEPRPPRATPNLKTTRGRN